MEHHLFSAPKEAPVVDSQLANALKKGNPRKNKKKNAANGDEKEDDDKPKAEAPATTPVAPVASNSKGKAKGKAAASTEAAITLGKSTTLDPTNKPLTVEAWIRGEQMSGVILTHGAGLMGYGLALNNGKPEFAVRINKTPLTLTAPIGINDGWHHIVGVLTEDKWMKLYVDGVVAQQDTVESLFTEAPHKGISIATENAIFPKVPGFQGWIDLIRISHSALSPEDAKTLFASPGMTLPASAKTVLAWTFEDKTAKDSSPNHNDGQLAPGLTFDTGADSKTLALHITTDAPKQGPGAIAAAKNSVKPPPNGYFVEPHWAHEVPIIARGMALANKVLFLAGPADIIDDEAAMVRINKGDTTIEPDLKKQDDLLLGKGGATLLAVDAESGKVLTETKLASPPQWDGMSAAGGAVFVSQLDGSVVCLEGR